MSIYCSTFTIGDEHSHRCARMKKIGRRQYRQDDAKPCTCGSAPFVYQGSHVLPKTTDARNGSIDLAIIPGYIRGGKTELPYYPWLRVGLYAPNGSTLILSREQAKALRDELSAWLRFSKPKAKSKRRAEIRGGK